MSASIKINKGAWDRMLKKSPGYVRQELRRAIGKVGLILGGQMSRRVRGRPGLKNRTGNLKRSYVSTVTEIKGGAQLLVGFGAKYAQLQERGGIVRPVKKKWLAIPVGPALTAAGVPRYPGPRSVKGLEFRPVSPTLALLVMPSTKEGAESVIWYVLKKQVVVPPRLGFFATFREFFKPNGQASRIIKAEAKRIAGAINNGLP